MMFCEVLFGYKLQAILVTLTILQAELGIIGVQLPTSGGGTNFSLRCLNSMDPPPWRCYPKWAMASSFLRFLYHTQRRITVCRTSLDEWSARRRDLYLTTLNTDIHAPGGIRAHNSSKRAAVDPRLRPRGHWDRSIQWISGLNRTRPAGDHSALYTVQIMDQWMCITPPPKRPP